MGLSKPFLFFPAHCWPYKNHAKLVEAFAQVEAELPKDLTLVFAGRSFPPDHPAAVLIQERGLGQRIRHLGYRSPLEVRVLFQSCQALVFPSLFEGFGIPVAEAMIAGRPVICSNVTSLPEIAGDAALTFDPNDAGDIGTCILEEATRTERRASLADAGLRRRALFSSRRSAVQTLAIYRRVFDEL
jgi:glycosyltransferase involved in cell wall biosynthesis